MMTKTLMLKKKMRMQHYLPITLNNKKGSLRRNPKQYSNENPLQLPESSRKKKKKLKGVGLSRQLSPPQNTKMRKIQRVETKKIKLQMSKKIKLLSLRTIHMTLKKIS
jgi:hypothetical protein